MTETISEIVEREASEAEREQEADEAAVAEGAAPEPAAEPEPETAPAELSSQTAVEERDKRLKSEETRHENALKKIYGDEFEQRAFCPLCIGEGFLLPIPAGQQSEEIWSAITALSGRLQASELRVPDEFQVCERCGGYGEVGTPSKSAHHVAVPCKHCDSRGYFDLSDAMHRGKLGLHEPVAPLTTAAPFTQWPQPTPAEPVQTIAPPSGWKESGSPGADTFGRWPGHPRYGIDPSLGGGW